MRSVMWDRADNSVNGSNEHVEHGHMVGHEEGIELCPLQCLDGVFEVGKVEIHVRPRARIAPGAGVDARRAYECTEMELP